MTPGMTPRAGTALPAPSARDNLNINESTAAYAGGADADDFMAEEEQAAVIAHKMQNVKKNLLEGLASLPAPKEYNVQVPEDIGLVDENMDESKVKKGTSSFVRDVEDIIKEKRQQLQSAREAELERRSQALKKDLPRPFRVNAGVCKSEKELEEMPRKTNQNLEDLATELVKAELVSVCVNWVLMMTTSPNHDL